MKRYAMNMGIPEENIYVSPENWLRDPVILEKTKVYAYPSTSLYSFKSNVMERDYDKQWAPGRLHVAAAGNVDESEGIDRELWYRDNPHWNSNKLWANWDAAFDSFATGRVIMAKYAVKSDDGAILPYLGNVKCGMAKEFCYSIFAPEYQNHGTSGASVNLGALSFYLSQLWETPREVIGVLNVCAEDVGEPGIDEEFGRGVVSVVCDTVQNRERTVAASSVGSPGAASSPVLDQMIGDSAALRPRPQSLMPPPLPGSGRFRPFYAVRLYDMETVSGYLGGEFSLKGTGFLVSGGADYAPLGVRSSLLYAARTPFIEFGGRRSLFSRGGHGFSLLGSYGRSGGDNLQLNVGRFGGQYRYRFTPSSVLSLYGGHRLAYGFLGIPGYRQAGAEPVSFVDHVPEARVSLAVRW